VPKQPRIIGLFLLNGLLEELEGLLAEEFRIGHDRIVAGDLVMLDALGVGDRGGVEDCRLLVLLDRFLDLGDQTLSRFASLAGGLLPGGLEDLLQAPDPILRLAQVLLEGGLELRVGGGPSLLGRATVIRFSAS
jgi:hypothetical protein